MLAETGENAIKASNDDVRLIRFDQTGNGWRAWLGLVTALTMVLSLGGGIFLLTSQALSEPEAVHLAIERPMVTIQIIAALLLLSTLFLVPARRLAIRAGRGSLIEIDGRSVRVSESGYLSGRSFAEPLDAYRGVAHRIRTTISGIRHELVLVHSDMRRDVVIALDAGHAHVTPARLMATIGLPEIAPGDIGRARRVAIPTPRA
jgi:hypothetical protein